MTADEIVARKVREARTRRTWSYDTLSERVRELGGKLGRDALRRIEEGNRSVSPSERLLLAAALDIAPNDMLIPDEGELLDVAPGWSLDRESAIEWFTGVGCVAPGGCQLTYIANRPAAARHWSQGRLRSRVDALKAMLDSGATGDEVESRFAMRDMYGKYASRCGDPDLIPDEAKARRYKPGYEGDRWRERPSV